MLSASSFVLCIAYCIFRIAYCVLHIPFGVHGWSCLSAQVGAVREPPLRALRILPLRGGALLFISIIININTTGLAQINEATGQVKRDEWR